MAGGRTRTSKRILDSPLPLVFSVSEIETSDIDIELSFQLSIPHLQGNHTERACWLSLPCSKAEKFMSRCLEIDIFLVNTVKGLKFSQHHSLSLYSAFQLEMFFSFKPSVPKYSTKYLKLNLAPKKENISSWDNAQPLKIISMGPSAHILKISLSCQCISHQSFPRLGLQDGLISIDCNIPIC